MSFFCSRIQSEIPHYTSGCFVFWYSFLPIHLRVFVTTESKLKLDETDIVTYPLNTLFWSHPSTFTHDAVRIPESSRTIRQLCVVG